MENGVRDQWIDHVVGACQRLLAEAATGRTIALRRLFDDFEKHLSSPKTPFEEVVLRGLLTDLALRFGHADHWAYHAEFPDADCTDDPAARAMSVWHAPSASAKTAFHAWARAFISDMERIHPRYRAQELRRELDADFAQPLSVAALARRRRTSVRCLQRDFEELTGLSVQDYVTERRLDAAVLLLRNTPDKVEWIANVVGWSSRKNLNRALARRRGVNPGDLRSKACWTGKTRLA